MTTTTELATASPPEACRFPINSSLPARGRQSSSLLDCSPAARPPPGEYQCARTPQRQQPTRDAAELGRQRLGGAQRYLRHEVLSGEQTGLVVHGAVRPHDRTDPAGGGHHHGTAVLDGPQL